MNYNELNQLQYVGTEQRISHMLEWAYNGDSSYLDRTDKYILIYIILEMKKAQTRELHFLTQSASLKLNLPVEEIELSLNNLCTFGVFRCIQQKSYVSNGRWYLVDMFLYLEEGTG